MTGLRERMLLILNGSEAVPSVIAGYSGTLWGASALAPVACLARTRPGRGRLLLQAHLAAASLP